MDTSPRGSMKERRKFTETAMNGYHSPDPKGFLKKKNNTNLVIAGLVVTFVAIILLVWYRTLGLSSKST